MRFIGIAHFFFEIIGYHYSTKRFIVPITASANAILVFEQLVSCTPTTSE